MRVIVVVISSDWKRLQPCWAALDAQSFCDFQVVLVDYGDDQALMQHVVFSRLGQENRVIIVDGTGTTINTARNLALDRIAQLATKDRPQYIGSLDDDSQPASAWLENLVAVADKAEERIGMFASKVLAKCGRRLRSAGHTLIPWGRPDRAYTWDAAKPLPPGEPLCPCHVGALLRWSMINEIRAHESFLDEDIEHYWTCFDAGIKAQILGWRCELVPTAIVVDAGFDADRPNEEDVSSDAAKRFKRERLKQESRLALTLKYVPDEQLSEALIAQLAESTARLLRQPEGGQIILPSLKT